MELIINGEAQKLLVNTIEDVVAYFGLIDKPIVVEADGMVLTNEQWALVTVRPGMTIELVHFVGGG